MSFDTRIVPLRTVATPNLFPQQSGTARTVADPRLYDEAFRRARDDPDAFWAEAAQGVHWYKQWDRVLDNSNPPFSKW